MAEEIARERLIIRARFAEICQFYPPWNSLTHAEQETKIRRLERNCFGVIIDECTRDGINKVFTDKKFVSRYSAICHKVMANLNVEGSVNSTYMIDKLIAGTVDEYKIGEMTSAELCPEANRALREDIDRRREIKTITKVSREYRCPKCGRNETIPIEYQGRCADEASSRSIKCVAGGDDCGHIWRRG